MEPISIISTASFWKTEDDANGAIRGMYARLRGVTATNLYIWGESRSQNLRQSVGNDFSNLRNFDNTLDATTAGPDWNSLYQVVNDANLVIKYVPSITFNVESQKQRIIAEAYTMRAFCYFVMAKTWGGVPLVTEPTEGYNPAVIYKERTSVEQIFDFIKSDIANALALFPDDDFANGRNRWSKPGVNALKGDVYLWTGKRLTGGDADIQEALTALNEVEKSDVTLLDSFESIFDYTNKGNREIIMANTFARFEASNTFMANMYIDAYPPNSDPDALEIIGTIGGGNYWTLTADVLAKFSDEDQRKSASFTELYSLDPNTGTYSKFYGCIQRKFNGMIDGGARYFLDDVVLYRYADVLLMKAEAQNALNQDPSEVMNRVRARAYGDNFEKYRFVSGSKEDNDTAILEERLLELLYEGKYWWDILRFDRANELIPYFKEHPQDTYKYLWPLSLNILSAEPKVTQNSGYQ
ncbi:RagB/SusD family nutrient uptake outer membrane protein [Parapedobacter indicus]|uniref:RagB/SusD family nutrient uptake outer membrane protein n=1 Tax=Parapedobacter indicus TaxID=1477437 RepID=UPI001FE8BD81|nr:RagB/SusD family nutrient uptake outer membrane protein [Parapedobacter indicus]